MFGTTSCCLIYFIKGDPLESTTRFARCVSSTSQSAIVCTRLLGVSLIVCIFFALQRKYLAMNHFVIVTRWRLVCIFLCKQRKYLAMNHFVIVTRWRLVCIFLCFAKKISRHESLRDCDPLETRLHFSLQAKKN